MLTSNQCFQKSSTHFVYTGSGRTDRTKIVLKFVDTYAARRMCWTKRENPFKILFLWYIMNLQTTITYPNPLTSSGLGWRAQWNNVSLGIGTVIIISKRIRAASVTALAINVDVTLYLITGILRWRFSVVMMIVDATSHRIPRVTHVLKFIIYNN